MIEDKELRDLFKAESEEHLQHLDEGLLHLETHPNDQASLEGVFREAHSLKGAARMLGVSDVETLAHRFEDTLGAAKRGETVLAPETITRLYRALDAMRKLVHEAVTGDRQVSRSQACWRSCMKRIRPRRRIPLRPNTRASKRRKAQQQPKTQISWP